ncbi:hypothetical protein D3C71_588500 [compost metagenome]
MSNNVVLTPGNDMYHFACLCKEVGELQVIGILAQRLTQVSHPCAATAVRAAVDQFELLIDMQNGQSIFAEIRAESGLGRKGRARKALLTEATENRLDKEQ